MQILFLHGIANILKNEHSMQWVQNSRQLRSNRQQLSALTL